MSDTFVVVSSASGSQRNLKVSEGLNIVDGGPTGDLIISPGSHLDSLVLAHANGWVGYTASTKTYTPRNFVSSSTINVNGGDGAGSPSWDVVPGTSLQRVRASDGTTTVTSTDILFTAGSGVSLAVANSGGKAQVTISSSGGGGSGTVTSVAVTSSDITVGGSPITTSGTITLSLNTVSIAKGGTGQVTKTLAYNALSPATTTGDIVFFNGTNNVRLGIGTAGQFLSVASGAPAWATVSGSGTVTSVAVTSSDLTVGGSPITASGTITLVLNTITIAKGGTGQTTKVAGFNALSPTTTLGDIIYSDGTNNVRLAVGTNGQHLVVASGIPAWSAASTGTVTSVAVTSSDITVGGSPITTTGTITLTLNTVTIAKGGTGQTTKTLGFNALSPTTTLGDIIYSDGTNNVRLAVGTNGQHLVVASGIPAWSSGGAGTVTSVAVTSSDITVGGSPITTSGTITLTLNTVSIAKGGTGQTTKTLAFNALSPTTTLGDMTYFDGTNNVRLAPGNLSSVLTFGAFPVWIDSISIQSGGTNANNKTSAFNNLAPTTTTGDIVYFDGTNNVRLGIGTTGQTLTVASGIPAWSSGGGGGVTSVAVTSNNAFITIGGSPITSSGTITLSVDVLTLDSGGTGQAFVTGSVGGVMVYLANDTAIKLRSPATGNTNSILNSAINGNPRWTTGASDTGQVPIIDGAGTLNWSNAPTANGQVFTYDSFTGVPAWISPVITSADLPPNTSTSTFVITDANAHATSRIFLSHTISSGTLAVADQASVCKVITKSSGSFTVSFTPAITNLLGNQIMEYWITTP